MKNLLPILKNKIGKGLDKSPHMRYNNHTKVKEREIYKMDKAIYFDMDGTIANFYGVENWLSYLINEQTKPYREATPLVNMRRLGRLLNTLQSIGYHIGIVSWLSKSGTETYNEKVTTAKLAWLSRHLSSVKFDEIHIVKYGTPKWSVVDMPAGLLFDDEEPNRKAWLGRAENVDEILETLSTLLKEC